LCAVSFLRVMGEAVPQAFFNVYLDVDLHLPAAQIGLLVGVGRLLAVPAGLFMPFLAWRWGNERTVVLGALGVAVSLLPLSLIPHWAAAGLGYMALTAMAAVARAAFIVFSMESVAPRWQGTLSALTTMAASVSRIATSLGAGYTVDEIGYRGTFLAGAGVTAAGAMLFWAAFCRRRCGTHSTNSAP
ncbi:MAG: MFS transporter, partial [Anaerolineae bacterium]|nr:MFS transporter [Anaerolineae bacterium]